jgi:hypothetical protein
MKRFAVAALLAAQIPGTAQPAFASDFTSGQEQRAGGFAGFRLRLALDGPERRQVRAGLALAPTLGIRDIRGATRTRIGEGVEFGFRGGRPLALSIAGREPNRRRLGASQNEEHHDTLPRVALAVAGVVVTLGLLYWGVSEAIDCDPEEECS